MNLDLNLKSLKGVTVSPDPYTRVGGESEPCHLARKQARPATLYLCSICICMQFVSVFKLFLCSICICVKFAYVCNSVKLLPCSVSYPTKNYMYVWGEAK